MAIYSRDTFNDSEEKQEKLYAPAGWHLMTITYEGVSKKESMKWAHLFKFENEMYQFWHAQSTKKLPEFAGMCGVEAEPDGSIDTSRFKNLRLKINLISEMVSGVSRSRLAFVGRPVEAEIEPAAPSSHEATDYDDDIPF